MIIDITPYKSYKPLLIEKANDHDIDRAIQIGVASGVPMIAIYTFLGEEFGGFKERIEELIEFYGYTKVIKE